MSELPVVVPGYSGCEWPLDPGCLGDKWDELPTAVQQRAQALAGQTLRRLTGYRVGGCASVVRPCKRNCVGDLYSPAAAFHPHINESSQWVNSCGCQWDCACGDLCAVTLPGPIGAVYEVQVDGVVLDEADYRISGNQIVYSGDPPCPFPVCQNMNVPIGTAGSFAITYLNAWPVDNLGAWAAGILAVEFAKACQGSTCKLPANVTSVVRQGVSFQIEGGAFPNGFTGIREVDAYIALWNPDGLRRDSYVWTPGRTTRSER